MRFMPLTGHRRSSGFSAIELMVVLAIVVIFLTIAVPGFSSMIDNQKITTASSDLFAAINLTRAEAIGRGTRVDLVPAGDGSDWSNGWIVFVDKDNDLKPDVGDHVIFSHGPVPAGINIKSAFTDSKVQYLSYTGTGRSRTNANSQTPQVGSWSFTVNSKVRRIKVNFLGRIRMCNPEIEKDTC